MSQTNLNHRFWCFGFAQYYPSGGLNDIDFTTDSEEEALAWYKRSKDEFKSIFDTETRLYVDTEEE